MEWFWCACAPRNTKIFLRSSINEKYIDWQHIVDDLTLIDSS